VFFPEKKKKSKEGKEVATGPRSYKKKKGTGGPRLWGDSSSSLQKKRVFFCVGGGGPWHVRVGKFNVLGKGTVVKGCVGKENFLSISEKRPKKKT